GAPEDTASPTADRSTLGGRCNSNFDDAWCESRECNSAIPRPVFTRSRRRVAIAPGRVLAARCNPLRGRASGEQAGTPLHVRPTPTARPGASGGGLLRARVPPLLARVRGRPRAARGRARSRPVRSTGGGGGSHRPRRRSGGSQGVGPFSAPVARAALSLCVRAARPAGPHPPRHRGKPGAGRHAATGREVGGVVDAPDRLSPGDGARGTPRRGDRVAGTGAGPRRRTAPRAAGEPRGRRGLVRLAPSAPARTARRGVARAGGHPVRVGGLRVAVPALERRRAAP